MNKKKILHLTLHKKAFEVMITGEKTEEFRKPTSWIKSRLVGDASKDYDLVKFVNGYGKDKPYFIAEFKDFEQYKETESQLKVFSNGLTVNVEYWDYIIYLGEIVEKGNL
jgi:hypothetical protein